MPSFGIDHPSYSSLRFCGKKVLLKYTKRYTSFRKVKLMRGSIIFVDFAMQCFQ
jgi:hypothetical protein